MELQKDDYQAKKNAISQRYDSLTFLTKKLSISHCLQVTSPQTQAKLKPVKKGTDKHKQLSGMF